MKNFFVLAAVFCLGYAVHDLSDVAVKTVKADVGGMSAFDLQFDYDFKQAVQKVVSDGCHVEDKKIICW